MTDVQSFKSKSRRWEPFRANVFKDQYKGSVKAVIMAAQIQLIEGKVHLYKDGTAKPAFRKLDLFKEIFVVTFGIYYQAIRA